jgi:hypothetical protein
VIELSLDEKKLRTIHLDMRFSIPAEADTFRKKVQEIMENTEQEINKLRTSTFLQQGKDVSKLSIEEIEQDEIVSRVLPDAIDARRKPVSWAEFEGMIKFLNQRIDVQGKKMELYVDEHMSLSNRVARLEDTIQLQGKGK